MSFASPVTPIALLAAPVLQRGVLVREACALQVSEMLPHPLVAVPHRVLRLPYMSRVVLASVRDVV